MRHILIVDSDTPEINTRSRSAVGQSTGEGYEAALRSCAPDVRTAIVTPYAGENLPDLEGIDGVVFTGSGVDWCVDDPRAKPLAEAMETCFAAEVPVLGSCNGMQLAAEILGGSNRASPKGREDGLARDIQMTEAGHAHPFLKGRQNGFAVPCVHRDEVDRLPDAAVLLASNAHSAVQVFAYDEGGVRFWGVQYHPEYTLQFIAGRARAWKRISDTFADDLARVAWDLAAAARLDVRPEDMQPNALLTEVRNWLDSL